MLGSWVTYFATIDAFRTPLCRARLAQEYLFEEDEDAGREQEVTSDLVSLARNGQVSTEFTLW